ncbi:UNVERIFIED_CONTAM: hypothetical protein RMT77_003027 [Armadillidium vulgare]
MSKERKYSDVYVKYGFSVIDKNGIQFPQCVLCHSVLSINALKPVRLQRHLTTNHAGLKDKPKEFFVAICSVLKCMKLDSKVR